MSAFGDWFVKARNAVEMELETLFVAVQPQVQTALVTAVQAGVAAATAKGGSAGDMWVAARDASLTILKAKGVDIAESVVENAVTHEIAAPSVGGPSA